MMISTYRTFALALIFALVTHTVFPTTPTISRELSPEQVAIRDAAMNPDREERQIGIESALRAGLLDPTPETRRLVLEFLWSNSRWIDFGPFEAIFREHDKEFHAHAGLWFLDINQLNRMSRDERLRIHQSAIVSGEVLLAFGRPWMRIQAIEAAAREGLSELESAVHQYYQELPDQFAQRFPIEKFELYVHLTAGGASREPAFTIAAQRLASIDQNVFSERMAGDPHFRDVAIEIAEYVCMSNPYGFDRNAGCGYIGEIVNVQRAVLAQRPSNSSASGPHNPDRVDEFARSSESKTWLETLQQLVTSGHDGHLSGELE
jgi:hypothetical protein